MTDGGENSSREYTASKVKEMIKHQEDKYNWEFIYMGSDLTNADDANSLGFSTRLYSSKANYAANYDMINSVLTCYRGDAGPVGEKGARLKKSLSEAAINTTLAYADEIGIDANSLLANDSDENNK